MKNREDVDDLLKGLLDGDPRRAGRILSLIENDSEEAPHLLKKIFPRVGGAYRIGITGLPGAGKSTLVDGLALEALERGHQVGILAVDPTSPFTGGALLGDRIRMKHSNRRGEVFVRSMATRGSLGGLARTTREAADVLDAFGKDRLFIETVGVGQSELDVIHAVDTTVVVLVPEFGGGVQALKAGLMEIADLFVVNKGDRAGADFLCQDLREALALKPPSGGWEVPVHKTIATSGEGVSDLFNLIEKHREYLENSGLFAQRRKEQARDRILQILKFRLEKALDAGRAGQNALERLAALCAEGKLDPLSAAEELFPEFRIRS